MLIRSAMILLMGGMLAVTPLAYSSEAGAMSDVHHRKTMSGLHHPEHADDAGKQDAEKEDATMSDAQHRKTMSGLHHPEHADDASRQDAEKESATMSDVHHRKTMGGLHHPDKE